MPVFYPPVNIVSMLMRKVKFCMNTIRLTLGIKKQLRQLADKYADLSSSRENLLVTLKSDPGSEMFF